MSCAHHTVEIIATAIRKYMCFWFRLSFLWISDVRGEASCSYMLCLSKYTLTPCCSYENSRICKDEFPYYEDFDSFRIVLYMQDISAGLSCLTWYISMELLHSNDTPFKTLFSPLASYMQAQYDKLSRHDTTSIYNWTCAEANSTTDRQLSWCMNVKEFTSQQEKFTTGEKVLMKLQNSPWALSSQIFA